MSREEIINKEFGQEMRECERRAPVTLNFSSLQSTLEFQKS